MLEMSEDINSVREKY